MKTDLKMQKLKAVQGKILENVELVQERTSRVLQEQERDLLRAFRARLFDVQTELEKEKSKKDDGAGAWIERSRQLEVCITVRPIASLFIAAKFKSCVILRRRLNGQRKLRTD